MISAVIFDLDGTLVETEELKAISHARSVVDLNPEVKEEDVVEAYADDLVGHSRREVATELVRRFGLEEAARGRMNETGEDEPWQVLVRIRKVIYDEILADSDLILEKRYPHNIEMLREMGSEGYPAACATMSHRAQVVRVLSGPGVPSRPHTTPSRSARRRFRSHSVNRVGKKRRSRGSQPGPRPPARSTRSWSVSCATTSCRFDRRAAASERKRSEMSRNIEDLPHALQNAGDLERRLEGKRPAVFLDYDGTLTPIVDRPEDAVISDSMREAVRGLAGRCPVCVVSGRDRKVVQELMGLDDLIVAGSHGFDIWSPDEGAIQHDAGGGFEELIDEVKTRLDGEIGHFQGISGIAGKVLNLLSERRRESLREKIGLTDEEVEKWDEMSRKTSVPFHGDGLVSQFGGYEDLEDLDWDHYREEYGNIQRLDRILRAEGEDPDRYKLAKQADAVLLFFLFPEENIKQLLERLGYDYEPDTIQKNIDYYDQRTSHGSTLSYVAHAGILAGLDPESSWERYMVALESDIGDVQGGTTQEGVHMGVMAGTLDLIQRSYAGSEVRDDTLYFRPKSLKQLDGLSFPMRFRGIRLELTQEGDRMTVSAQADGLRRPVKVGVGDEVRELKPGESQTFEI